MTQGIAGTRAVIGVDSRHRCRGAMLARCRAFARRSAADESCLLREGLRNEVVEWWARDLRARDIYRPDPKSRGSPFLILDRA